MTMTAPGVSASEARLEIVRDGARLAAISPAWRQLWERSGALIFQHPDWILAWWNSAPDAADRELRIVLAWRGEELEAILPLATSKKRGMRMLQWAAMDYADYCDALQRPDCGPDLLGTMWEHVCGQGGFDIAYLARILPGASVRSLMINGNRRGVPLLPNRRSEQSLRVVGKWSTGEAWFEDQAKKTRQNYRRGVKFLGDGANLGFRLLPPEQPIAPVLERLSVLKRQWLESNGIQAPLFDEGAPMLAALIEVLARSGQLHAFVLERDDTIVAISINFVQAGTMMAFLTSYDPDVERGSPGMVLMIDYIKWSFDNGLGCVDFLLGAEDFKSRFGTETVTLNSFAGSRSLTGRATLTADKAIHWLKSMRNA